MNAPAIRRVAVAGAIAALGCCPSLFAAPRIIISQPTQPPTAVDRDAVPPRVEPFQVAPRPRVVVPVQVEPQELPPKVIEDADAPQQTAPEKPLAPRQNEFGSDEDDPRIVEKPVAKPDPQMQSVLDQWADLAEEPLTKFTPAEARGRPTGADAVKMLMKKHGKSFDPLPMGSVKDIAIVGPDGRIPARIYIPQGAAKPMPVVVYWHGGGWVLGNLDTYDASCRALARGADCMVISCDYRLAPESHFPAAADDAYNAYQWVIGNIQNYGGDPKRVAVAGESAGGNLAAVVAQRTRDDEIQQPVFQLLIYPVLDCNVESDSYHEHAQAAPLNREMMKWFIGHYLSQKSDADNPYASPLRAKSFEGLAPAMIITADIDPLRSEAQAYAIKLRDAGVPMDYVNYKGMTHEFFGMGNVVDKANSAVRKASDALIAAFEKAAGETPSTKE